MTRIAGSDVLSFKNGAAMRTVIPEAQKKRSASEAENIDSVKVFDSLHTIISRRFSAAS